MRMRRQAVMLVLADIVMRFTRLIGRVDMNDHQCKIIQVMKELVSDLSGDGMGL